MIGVDIQGLAAGLLPLLHTKIPVIYKGFFLVRSSNNSLPPWIRQSFLFYWPHENKVRSPLFSLDLQKVHKIELLFLELNFWQYLLWTFRIHLVTRISFFVCHLNASSWRWTFLRRAKFLHDSKKPTVSVEISHLRETRFDHIRKQRHKLVYFMQCTIFLPPAKGEGEAVREAGGLTNAWANHDPEISSNRERERESKTRRQPSGRNTEKKETRTEIN